MVRLWKVSIKIRDDAEVGWEWGVNEAADSAERNWGEAGETLEQEQLWPFPCASGLLRKPAGSTDSGG